MSRLATPSFSSIHLVNPDVHPLNGLSVAVTLDGTPAAPHLSLPNEKTLRENRGKDTSKAFQYNERAGCRVRPRPQGSPLG